MRNFLALTVKLAFAAAPTMCRQGHRGGGVRMAGYKVNFFKDLLSSDGHPFKVLQRTITVARSKTPDRAVEVAQRQFERVKNIPDWKLHADSVETELL
jgi:hypothetical protein